MRGIHILIGVTCSLVVVTSAQPADANCASGAATPCFVALHGASTSYSYNGVEGDTVTGNGIEGHSSGTGVGVHGDSVSGIGVQGVTSNATSPSVVAGVLGAALGAGTYGVWGSSTNTDAVVGEDLGSGSGVYGSSNTGYGGRFYSAGGNGLYGYTASNSYAGVIGVSGASNNGTGIGVYGVTGGASMSTTGEYAVYGTAGGTAGTGGSSGSYAGYFNGNVRVAGALYFTSCPSCTSDVRLKKNVKPLHGAIDELLKLKGVTFEWKNPEEHENDSATVRGFIAQDVEKVEPSWVKQEGYKAPDGNWYKTIDTRQIEALEVESIRTLKAENDGLRADVDALKDQLGALAGGKRPNLGTSPGSVLFEKGGWGVSGLLLGLLVASKRKRDSHQI
jgi:Chaperone of endosialidase